MKRAPLFAPLSVAVAALAVSASVLFAAPLLAPAATADTMKDGQISVAPGLWRWKQETKVIGMPIKEDNTECLIPEEATITLSQLAYDLDEGCTVDNVRPATGGYAFQLICRGKIPGKAEATLTHSHHSMAINAKGSARVIGVPAGFSMRADATYLGECPAEEVERRREKWLEEQAKKQAATSGGSR